MISSKEREINKLFQILEDRSNCFGYLEKSGIEILMIYGFKPETQNDFISTILVRSIISFEKIRAIYYPRKSNMIIVLAELSNVEMNRMDALSGNISDYSGEHLIGISVLTIFNARI